MTLAALATDWRRYNDLIVDALGSMSTAELAMRLPSADEAASTGWPIWAIAGHSAGTRPYWLCTVMGRPGADRTPFVDPAGVGWEDDLARPRTAAELVMAWRTTWMLVEGALMEWTPADLDAIVERVTPTSTTHFTRRSLLLRLVTHESFHAGEIAAIQAVHGLPPIDLWPPGFHGTDLG